MKKVEKREDLCRKKEFNETLLQKIREDRNYNQCVKEKKPLAIEICFELRGKSTKRNGQTLLWKKKTTIEQRQTLGSQKDGMG